MNIPKITWFILLLLSLFPVSETGSQVFNKFGIKGGAIFSGMSLSEFYPGIFRYNPSNSFKLLSIDFGIYGEFFNSRHFSTNTEIHYTIRGEGGNQLFEFLQTSTGITGLEYRTASNRFHYISFQILPKWKFIVNTENNVYLFGGPRFDLRVSNSNTLTNDYVKFDNSGFETGFTVGAGDEISDMFHFELRYERNFTSSYELDVKGERVTRKLSSFSLLLGVSLKKLLRIAI